VLSAALALAAAACSDREPTGGNEPDRTPPTLSIASGTPAADTIIAVSVNASDNLGLKQIIVQVRGAVTLDTVITYNTVVLTQNLDLTFVAPRSVAPGTIVTVSAEAIDGRGNRSGVQTTTATVGNLPAPTAVITSPRCARIHAIMPRLRAATPRDPASSAPPAAAESLRG
jgi:hypothetical protein